MPARAVWFRAPRQVELEEVELAEPAADQVVVRTLYSGISSGTELLAYRGQLPDDLVLDESIDGLGGTFAYPFRYGYSCVGRVQRGAGGVAEGALVFAFHPHQDTFVAGASDVVVLDDGTDPRVATMYPLVETALQVSLDAGPVAHEAVVVTGLGAVGLLTAVLLRGAGAHVVGADPLPWRRTTAEAVGIEVCAPEELADRVGRCTSGRGLALLVEASGNPDALARGLDLLAHEGTALVASWYGTKSVALPLGGAFHRRRITIRSTQVSTIPARLSGRWTVARRRAAAHTLLRELPLDRLATHDMAFDDAAAAFAALDRGEEGLVHMALRYE